METAHLWVRDEAHVASATNSKPGSPSNYTHSSFHQGKASVLVKHEPLSLFNLILFQVY